MNICILDLTIDEKIQFGLLFIGFLTVLVGAITAYILLRTLKEGQKQSKEGQRQTGYSLAINQYNIQFQDLMGIINKFKEINFKENFKKYKVDENIYPLNFRYGLNDANGINTAMIYLFIIFSIPYKNETTKDQLFNFRLHILFPLLREYKSLLHFLNEIKDDTLLSQSHKNKFYKIIERDVLQSYFRICNNHTLPVAEPDYDLSCYPKNNIEDFCAINEFYIANSAFQYNTLEFYQNTI